MRCLACEKLSFRLICKNCQKVYFEPFFRKRIIENILDEKREKRDFDVYYFYNYDEISTYIKTKHTFLGYFVLNILAKNSFLKFAKNFEYSQKILVIPVDDDPKGGYSHTAILANALKSKVLKPTYNVCRDFSGIKYSGQTLKYRQENKKQFKINLKNTNNLDIILVDDVVTTGLTFLQSKKALEEMGYNVLFGLALASA